MDLKYLLKIFIIIFLILSIILFINNFNFKFKQKDTEKKLLQVVTIEGLENPITTNGNQAFCDLNKGFELETACNNLTKYNCNLTSCCIFDSDKKCKAGNVNGPLFNSDSNGKTKEVDYYYFKNKCYGKSCP